MSRTQMEIASEYRLWTRIAEMQAAKMKMRRADPHRTAYQSIARDQAAWAEAQANAIGWASR